jgi:hypothetical protein
MQPRPIPPELIAQAKKDIAALGIVAFIDRALARPIPGQITTTPSPKG